VVTMINRCAIRTCMYQPTRSYIQRTSSKYKGSRNRNSVKYYNYIACSILFAPVHTLEYSYIISAAIAALSAFLIVEKVIPHFQDVLKPDHAKDFKRSPARMILHLFFAFFWVIFGYFFIHIGFSFLFFIVSLIIFFFYLLIFFWLRKTPYVRITTDTIIVFTALFKIEKAPQNMIKKCDINLKKKRVDIILPQAIVRIHLSRVSNPDKEKLIKTLSNL
jgi:ABC-type antimicrobial peptide transport system permease subunit